MRQRPPSRLQQFAIVAVVPPENAAYFLKVVGNAESLQVVLTETIAALDCCTN